MSDELPVHVNRERHHAVDVAAEAFEPTGDFVVRVTNHGEGSHVHVGLDGDLAERARVLEDNRFVEAGSAVEIPVEVRTDIRPVRGAVEVVTGYGDESDRVDVTVTREDDPVVGSADPSADADGTSGGAATSVVPEDALPVLGLALLALGLAGLAVSLTESTVVVLGALVVIGTAVVGAGYVLAT